MASREHLGEFELMVMLAILRLGPDAYGMTVRNEIRRRGGRDVSIPTVYSALNRLENKGLVHSRTSEATPERGGRAKRYFVISSRGLETLHGSVKSFVSMVEGLFPEMLSGEEG